LVEYWSLEEEEMKEKVTMVFTRDEIARMLLKLMAQCYASGKDAIKDDDLLATLRVPVGFRAYVAKEGKWFCVDAYTVGEMGYSWGFAVLYYESRPIFFMNFGGYVDPYLCEQLGINPKQVTAFLRKALLEQYSKWEEGQGAFLGCRGPSQFVDKEVVANNKRLLYENSPLSGNTIHTVRGSDDIIIFDPAGQEESRHLYHHDYLGGLLVSTI
jgi:hypothetical protein